jgi:hypothetical protein
MIQVVMAEELAQEMAAKHPGRVQVVGDSPPYGFDPRVAIVSAAIGAGLVIAWYKCRHWLADFREQNQVVTGGQSLAATRDMADDGSYPRAFSMWEDAPRGGQDNGNPSLDGSLDYRLPSDTSDSKVGLSRDIFAVSIDW